MKLTRLYGLHFLNDGLQGALLVLLPFISGELGMTEGQVGWVVFACFLLGSLFSVPASVAAGRLGGRWLLPAAVFVSGLCFAAAALATSFGSVFAVYLAAGIGFGVFHPIAFALIARQCDPRNTSRVMGLFTAAGDVGRIIAVAAVVALLAFVPWRLLLVTMGILVAVGVLVFALGFHSKREKKNAPTSPQRQRRAPRPRRWRPRRWRPRRWRSGLVEVLSCRGNMRRIAALTDKGFWLLCAIGFCDGLANSSLYVFLPFLLLAKGCGQAQLAVLMPLFFAACLSGRVVMGWLGDRLGRVGSLAACQTALVVVIAGLCASSEIIWVALGVSLLGICTRGSLPLVQSLTADRLPPEMVESGFAINQMVLGVAATLSPLLLGYVSRTAGTSTAFGWAGGLCALNVALVLALRILTAPRTVRLDSV